MQGTSITTRKYHMNVIIEKKSYLQSAVWFLQKKKITLYSFAPTYTNPNVLLLSNKYYPCFDKVRFFRLRKYKTSILWKNIRNENLLRIVKWQLSPEGEVKSGLMNLALNAPTVRGKFSSVSNYQNDSDRNEKVIIFNETHHLVTESLVYVLIDSDDIYFADFVKNHFLDLSQIQ